MKKIVSVLAAAIMACALPTAAFAVESPSAVTNVPGGNGVTASVAGEGYQYVNSVAATDDVASNVPEGVTPVASFDIEGKIPDGQTVTLAFTLGTQYNGYAVTIYVEHSDGTEEVLEGVVENGVVSVTVDRLSTFSIVLGDYVGTGSDASGTSPATSASLIAIAGVTAASTLGAGAVAFTLRKKVSE